MDRNEAIRWFENIAYECDKLTSGNVAHLRTQIKGMAIRSAEYLKKHSQEPASEDLEKEIDRYFLDYKVPNTGKQIVKEECWLNNEQVYKFAQHIAQWQKAQMMKAAIEGKVVAVRTTTSDRQHTYPWIELEAQLSKNDKVKVIIIKE